jgi:hypothetical protein
VATGNLQREGDALDRGPDLVAELAIAGCSGVVPVRRGDDVAVVPLADVVAEQRRVPRELYELARAFG